MEMDEIINSDIVKSDKKRYKLPGKKTMIIASAVVLFIILVVVIALNIGGSKKSSVTLSVQGIEGSDYLEALSSSAKNGFLESGKYGLFKFSDEDKTKIENIFKENKNIALNVRIKINKENEMPENSTFQLGFLRKSDFNDKGKLLEKDYPNDSRTLVKGNLEQAPEVFDVAFALKNKDGKDTAIPEGFFIYTKGDCQVVSTKIVPLELGFDTTRDVPFYGYSSNGGFINFANNSFDFSGATLVFPTKISDIASLPEFCIKLSNNPAFKSTAESGAVYSYLNFGGEVIKIHNVKPAKEVIVPSAGLRAPFSPMKIDSNAMCITSVILRATDIAGKKVVKPIRTDPGLILDYKQSAWRNVDYELFEWDRYPKILFFDTRNYTVQDNFFRRLAYFVEKNGYKGRILSNEELEGKHGYNAHDYSAISMADFFNKAFDMGFLLNKEELLLKEILIQNGLFEENGNYVIPNEGGIVSISHESGSRLRKTFLAHEGWHTIFFKDEEFRNFVSAVYYTLDPYSREWLSDYFTANPSLQYDTDDDYLMNNEFMAYIMQQDLTEVGPYFVGLAQRSYVKAYTPELSDYIIKTHARGFEDAAIMLNDFVFDKYGIVCGNICLVDKN